MKEESVFIEVLLVQPDEQPKKINITNSFQDIQGAICGPVESIGISYDTCILCNQYREVMQMPFNRQVDGVEIQGPFVVCGFDEDGTLSSLSDNDIDRYTEMFSI